MSEIGFTTGNRNKGKCVQCLSITENISEKFNVWCCSNECLDKIVETIMKKVRKDGDE